MKPRRDRRPDAYRVEKMPLVGAARLSLAPAAEHTAMILEWVVPDEQPPRPRLGQSLPVMDGGVDGRRRVVR